MSGGIDTSIYRQTQQPPNMLEQLAGLVGIQNAMKQGQIQDQTLNRLTSDRAVGEAIQAATGADGQIDVNKFGSLVKANPQAAYGAVQAAQNALAVRGGQIGNQQAGTNLGITRQSQIASGIAGLVSDPTLTRDKVHSFVDQQVKAGVIPAEYGAQVKSETAGLDGRGLREYARQHFNTVSGLRAADPAVIGTTPEGAQIVGTQAQRVTKTVQEGGVVPSMAPGQAEAQTVDLKGSAERGQSLKALAEQVPQRKATLNNMLGLLNEFRSGKGAKTEANYRSALGRFGRDPGSTATGSTEEFAKLANQIAAQQASQLGTTDQQQRTVMGANPSTEFSKLGNERVIATLLGNEDAIRAKNEAFARFQDANPQGTYDKFSSAFNREFDPRVFQYLNMGKAQRDDFRKGLSPAQAQAFSTAANRAIQHGWIGAPNGR